MSVMGGKSLAVGEGGVLTTDDQVGSCPIVTSHHSSTALYQAS